MKTAYFVKIDAQNNNNRYYKMYQNSPKSFLVEIGRVGIQPITRPYPLSSWDTVYQKKLAEGYIDRTPLTQITKSGKYKEIEDPEVRELIDFSRHRQFSDKYKHAGRLSPERAHGARNSSLHPVFTA